jgi:hypothetical protein
MASDRQVRGVIPKMEHDTWVVAATMDHSDICGLADAFHHFFAGLPRSRDGDHPRNHVSSVRSSNKIVEDCTHRSNASRSRFGVWPGLEVAGDGHPAGDKVGAGTSVPRRHVLADIPDKTGEFAGDGDADGGPRYRNPVSHEKHNPVTRVENWHTPMLVGMGNEILACHALVSRRHGSA